ncbi:conserved hypothetical protein [Ricinus communis]|uniref:Uncharacterized protein n=1 Tax=Ricinus communis TaxID=3988 RepID=B9SQD0_RICCO|nr:conserved hypothetical protein [Ricinus communis]
MHNQKKPKEAEEVGFCDSRILFFGCGVEALRDRWRELNLFIAKLSIYDTDTPNSPPSSQEEKKEKSSSRGGPGRV